MKAPYTGEMGLKVKVSGRVFCWSEACVLLFVVPVSRLCVVQRWFIPENLFKGLTDQTLLFM